MRKINIIILLVFCLTLLLLSGYIVNTVIATTAIENIENQEDINQSSNNFQSSSTGSVQEPTEEPETENSGKWSGLGMMICQIGSDAEYDGWIDTLLANGFDEFREIPYYENTAWLASSKAALLRNIYKGAKYVWGVASSSLTVANWATYRTAVLDAATWAQANGVYEFQIGNEAEYNNYYYCTPGKLVRVDNVVTVTTPAAHGFDGEHQVTVSPIYWNDAVNPADMAGTFDITVVDTTHFTYVAVGNDGSNISDATVTDIPIATLIANLKSLATEVQAIFTNGNVSYSVAYPGYANWIAAGKGDIDLIAGNVYRDNGWWIGDTFSDYWEDSIDALVAAFGVNGTYLTEFNLSSINIENYSTDEAVQATGINEMIDYIKASGITRAIYFIWYHPGFNMGVLKSDGTYRLLWNSLLGLG